jgi:voltage-gated potassium channel
MPTVPTGAKPALPLATSNYSAIKFLVALVFLFVSAPFVEDLPRGDVIEGMLLTLVMVFAALAVSGRRRSLLIALVLVIPAIMGKWTNHLYPDLMSPAFFLAPMALFFAFVLAQTFLFILRAPRVDANVLCAGVAGFLTLGLIWVPLYTLVGQLNPAAFTVARGPGADAAMDGFNAFYFSLVTLCTVGYGDITPTSKVARMLAVMEAASGLFYMTILISRLVSVYSTTGRVLGTKENRP